MNLEAFGQKLRTLRKRIGLTQDELAHQLGITAQLLSVWERAYQHRTRTWIPDRQTAVALVAFFAEQLSPDEAQSWLYLLDLQLTKTELTRIWATDVPILPITSPRANLTRLRLAADQALFGIATHAEQLLQQFAQPTGRWIIALDGLGGIGKTALATYLAQQLMTTESFFDLLWISARQEEKVAEIGERSTVQPEFTIPFLVDAILEQVGAAHLLVAPPQEKKLIAQSLLKSKAYLLVIDNLEAIAHDQSWVTELSAFTNPSQFLLTTRHRLQIYPDIYCHTVDELTAEDVIEFLQAEAAQRGLSRFVEASQNDWRQLYDVVGGNPLALKLILGQLTFFSLPQVLDNLVWAKGRRIEALYSHIYWQAWHALHEPSRKALLMMPLVQGGDFTQLMEVSELEEDQLQEALEQLITFSLVIVTGVMDHRRYTIHRLTETFLLHEVLKW